MTTKTITCECDECKGAIRKVQFECGCAITYLTNDKYYRSKNCALHVNMSNEKFWLRFIQSELEK